MEHNSPADERAVSTLVGYALGVGIATLLITGLLAGIGGFVTDQRETTARSELRVLGNQLSADLRAADTLVRTNNVGSPPTLELRRDFPDTAVGVTYTISVNPGGCTCLILAIDNPDVTVEVEFTTMTPVDQRKISGGDVRIVFDSPNNELVVLDA